MCSSRKVKIIDPAGFSIEASASRSSARQNRKTESLAMKLPKLVQLADGACH